MYDRSIPSICCWLTVAALVWACDDAQSGSTADAGTDGGAVSSEQALVRGRVTDVNGQPVAELEVMAEGVRGRTDAQGRFELEVPAGQEVRVSVDSEEYSGAELPVTAEREAPANVEVAVKPRRRLRLPDADQGGRVEGDQGFALEVPAGALRTPEGERVEGEVEIRYALVNRPEEVTAAPGRMQRADRTGLDGYGMAEVRFYQDGRRLRLEEDMRVELPMHPEHGLRQGAEVDGYSLGEQDLRWQRGSRATVNDDVLVLRTRSDAWVGAARALPADSCVSGRLGTELRERLVNTTLRAARDRGLSLVQAETREDGSFCLPVTPDDDWRVSTFYDDGREAFALEVALNSSDAAGMCGGDGCKSVGDVQVPRLARP